MSRIPDFHYDLGFLARSSDDELLQEILTLAEQDTHDAGVFVRMQRIESVTRYLLGRRAPPATEPTADQLEIQRLSEQRRGIRA